MPASQQIPQDAASPANGHSTVHDLFALTDEQILEIEPEAQDAGLSNDRTAARTQEFSHVAPACLPTSSDAAPQNEQSRLEAGVTQTSRTPAPTEPPPWLAAQMKDPWSGEEAKELWNGVQQARQEAAAYRARVLDGIDRAYFGAAGKSAQEVSASRAQLAQKMMHEDPAAFREMVFTGLRALEASGVQAGSGATVGSRFSTTFAAETASAQTGASAAQTHDGLKSAPTQAPAQRAADAQGTEHDASLAAYASFEKAANDDLERSVGATIERTLQQALPNASRVSYVSGVGAQHAAPLQARLSQAIRQDIEAALKSDRQLGEQVALILSGRRLDAETRGQVVRLIGERAQQLVPVAAKRVLNDWTQTTLSAHRGNTARADSASTRREVAPASSDSRSASLRPGSSGGPNRAQSQDPNRGAARSDMRRVDYRKLSDEQILDL